MECKPKKCCKTLVAITEVGSFPFVTPILVGAAYLHPQTLVLCF